jgi:hypothetical protein
MTNRKNDRIEDPNDLPQDDYVISVALRRSLAVIGMLAAVALVAWGVYSAGKPKPVEVVTQVQAPEIREVEKSVLPTIPLADITTQVGIDFRHHTGKEGERLLPETMGGGGGFFDFDNDGDQDILLINGSDWAWSSKVTSPKPTMKLYRNDDKGTKFVDVTKDVGLDQVFYGMGPAFGDFDGDGWVDLFVTAIGGNHLYRNEQGKFVDVTSQFRVGGGGENRWSCPAMWFDFDRDNDLDLLVGDYVVWSRELDLRNNFTLTGVGRAYGQPTNFGGSFLTLYRNDGKEFSDVSESANLQIRNAATQVPSGKSLALAPVDVNRDGWMDVMVANDTVANFLLLNQKDGTFKDIGVTAGVAFDRRGIATGAMGIDCGFLRNDDNMAIAIGNFANEPCSLYVSRGAKPQFFDSAALTGFGPQTLLRLTFGIFFADMDLDGRLDIVCSNGHLEEEISKVQPTEQYEQPPQVFWNAGTKAATELVELGRDQVGDAFLKPMVGRGACYADIDLDGDLDILLISNGGPPRLLRNEQSLGNHWLQVKLVGKSPNRDAIGAEVRVPLGDSLLRRQVAPTRSYLSQCELPVTFGLGKESKISKLEIVWPDGTLQTIDNPPIDQKMTIEQSTP